MGLLKPDLYKLLLLWLVLVLLHGCSSMQTMSSYARTGDTVTVALGGTEDSNALVAILKKEDIAVTITDSALNTYPVTLRHLFRVYPDHTSTYTFNTRAPVGSSPDSYAPALLGQWMATVDLFDPVDSSLPALATGPATISVSSPAQLEQNHLYSTLVWTNGNLASINIEVLPGTGTPNNLNYQSPISFDPISTLEPLPQIIVAPSAAPATLIAGGDFKFVYNTADFAGGGLIVVPANHDPNVQLTSNITDLGDGITKELHVMIMNPRGFSINDDRALSIFIGGMSPLRSSRFAIVFNNGAIANSVNWQNSINMISGSYIDLQGNTIIDITPVLTKVR